MQGRPWQPFNSTSYQSNMTTETYDALRTIQDFWDVEDLEEIEITSELESSVASASERYREVTKEKQVLNSRKNLRGRVADRSSGI